MFLHLVTSCVTGPDIQFAPWSLVGAIATVSNINKSTNCDKSWEKKCFFRNLKMRHMRLQRTTLYIERFRYEKPDMKSPDVDFTTTTTTTTNTTTTTTKKVKFSRYRPQQALGVPVG
jgi:hypothetical protein